MALAVRSPASLGPLLRVAHDDLLRRLHEPVLGHERRVAEAHPDHLLRTRARGATAASPARARCPIGPGTSASASRMSAIRRGSGRRSGIAGETSVSVRTSSGRRAATTERDRATQRVADQVHRLVAAGEEAQQGVGVRGRGEVEAGGRAGAAEPGQVDGGARGPRAEQRRRGRSSSAPSRRARGRRPPASRRVRASHARAGSRRRRSPRGRARGGGAGRRPGTTRGRRGGRRPARRRRRGRPGGVGAGAEHGTAATTDTLRASPIRRPPGHPCTHPTRVTPPSPRVGTFDRASRQESGARVGRNRCAGRRGSARAHDSTFAYGNVPTRANTTAHSRTRTCRLAARDGRHLGRGPVVEVGGRRTSIATPGHPRREEARMRTAVRSGGSAALLLALLGAAWAAGAALHPSFPGAAADPAPGVAAPDAAAPYRRPPPRTPPAATPSSRAPPSSTRAVPGEYAFTLRGTGALAAPPRLTVVRRDATHLVHAVPTADADGAWHAALTLPAAGEYRVVVEVTPGRRGTGGAHGRPRRPRPVRPVPLTPSRVAEVDGYQVRLDGDLVPGTPAQVFATVSRERRPGHRPGARRRRLRSARGAARGRPRAGPGSPGRGAAGAPPTVRARA